MYKRVLFVSCFVTIKGLEVQMGEGGGVEKTSCDPPVKTDVNVG